MGDWLHAARERDLAKASSMERPGMVPESLDWGRDAVSEVREQPPCVGNLYFKAKKPVDPRARSRTLGPPEGKSLGRKPASQGTRAIVQLGGCFLA